ncbi:MAG: hypothetical protein AMXMBFR13_48450 [Phycisphaerae bacterium]|jgi:exodeoxyribonuclease VII small subunit
MAKKETEKDLTFEEAKAQLDTIITAIEQGKIGLEESIAQYERGMKLYQHCKSILSAAEAKIQQLQLAEDGTATVVPLDVPAE